MRYVRYFINIIFIVLAFFIISREFRNTYYDVPLLFKEANKSILFLLVIFQGLNYLGDGWLSQILLGIAGFKVKLKDTIKTAILGVVGNHVAPFVGGAIILYRSYKKLEIPWAVISFLIFSWTAFIWLTYLIFFFFSLLFLPNLLFNFVPLKIISVLLFGLILIAFVGFFGFKKRGKYAFWFSDIFSKIIDKLGGLQHLRINFFRSEPFKKFISDFHRCFFLLGKNKNKVPYALFFSFLFYLGDIFTLYFSFLVFGFKANLALLIFGYTFSFILPLFILMPGIPGVAETSLIVVFIKLSFPAHIVLFASLLFRIFSYWLPLPLAAFSYWRLKKNI